MSKSRRDFLKFSTLGAGALALASVNANATLPEYDVKFDEEYDVVVVGTGFAGLAAAIKAGQRGKKVLVLEKMGRIGGNSVINGGGMAVPNNPVQAKTGIKDSKELFIADCLKAGRGINHTELLEVLADNAIKAYEFLISCGVEFKTSHCAHFGGHSVARSMLSVNDSGSGYIQPMIKTLEKNSNVKVLRRAKFDDFVLDKNGEIIGIKMRQNYKFDPKLDDDDLQNTSGEDRLIGAKDGVILASGGFCSDKTYRKLQDPRISDDADSTNHSGATAGAMLRAFNIGAYPVQVSHIQFGPWASPDERGFGIAPILTQQGTFKYGIAVDVLTSKRFMNELADRKTRADAEFLILRANKDAYPVTFGDKNVFRDLSSEMKQKAMTNDKVVIKCDSVAQLANKFGMDEKVLLQSIQEYNKGVADKKDEFGKPVEILNGEGIDINGPFYAIRLSPKPHHTMGGIKINTKAQVLSSKDNKPIKNLFAAGEVTGGTHGASRLGTVALTDCIVFGMVAGENI